MRFLQGLMSNSNKINVARTTESFLIFLVEMALIFLNTFDNISGLEQDTAIYNTSF